MEPKAASGRPSRVARTCQSASNFDPRSASKIDPLLLMGRRRQRSPVVAGPLARAVSFDPGTPVYNTGMSGADLAQALGVARSP